MVLLVFLLLSRLFCGLVLWFFHFLLRAITKHGPSVFTTASYCLLFNPSNMFCIKSSFLFCCYVALVLFYVYFCLFVFKCMFVFYNILVLLSMKLLDFLNFLCFLKEYTKTGI